MQPSTKGTFTVALSFLLWGLFPLYWKQLAMVPSLEILCHRIVWGFTFFIIVIIIQKKWHLLHEAMTNKRSFLTLLVTAGLITVNWLVFIWAVNSGQIVEASLGYFINPLVNVLLGIVILREKLYRWQVLAVFLAGIGVILLTVQYGRIPWIAFSLALSFGTYGFLRKLARAESLIGLTVETAVLSPIALFFLFFLKPAAPITQYDTGIILLLVGGGVVTAIPLLLFHHGTKYIKYTTTGFLQYIAPSLQLLIGVAVYKETFTVIHFLSFSLIWSALLIYSISNAVKTRQDRTLSEM